MGNIDHALSHCNIAVRYSPHHLPALYISYNLNSAEAQVTGLELR